MSRLQNLKTLFSDKDIKGNGEFYDSIVLDVRSLQSLVVEPEHCGALLIPIVIGKLPPEICLIINRKLGEIGYTLPKLLDFLKEENQVREKSNSTIHLKEKSDSRSAGKNDNITNMTANELLVTTNTSHVGVKRTPVDSRICVFCRRNHCSNQCTVISDIKARKEFSRAHGHSFSCLNTGHISRNCGSTIRCYFCKSHHNSAICDKRNAKSAGDSVNTATKWATPPPPGFLPQGGQGATLRQFASPSETSKFDPKTIA